MPKRADRLITVFTKRQPVKSQPYCVIDVDTARDLVHTGMARWENKCRSIRFLHEDAVARLRDQSCEMGSNITFRAVAGSRYHQALVEAWRPKFRCRETVVSS